MGFISLLATAMLLAASPDTGAVVWTDSSGHTRTLEDYRGDVVVLNFWATWCQPCVKELPLLSRIQRDYAIDGVRVIGVSADEAARADQVMEFARKRKVNFPILLGATTTQMKSLGLGEALPATAVLNRDGEIVARFRGVIEKGDLEPLLERLLKGEEPGDRDHGDEHDHNDSHVDDDENEAPVTQKTEASLVPS
jgi:thiol-disulfide isomerase/thioredoxin